MMVDDPYGAVLDRLGKLIADRRGSQITGNIIDKRTGKRIGYRGTLQMDFGDRIQAVLTGFKYLPEAPETIGVTEKLAKIGAAEERHVIVYFDDRKLHQAMVFHPEAHIQHGTPEVKKEKRQKRNERWRNLDRSWACTLREFAEQKAEPQVQPRETEQRQAEGGWFDA